MATPGPQIRPASPWKRVAIISFFGGVGFAFAVALIVGSFVWYKSRPEPPKPWNTTAITASYDYADTNDENKIVFHYILENATDRDYKVENKSGIVVGAKLAREKSLSLPTEGMKGIEIDYPVFVPTKQRILFGVIIPYAYGKKLKSDASREERKKFRKELEEYAASEFPNVDGFVLFDSDNRFQINFPKGW